MSAAADRHAEYDQGRLFVLSVLALTTAGINMGQIFDGAKTTAAGGEAE